MESCNLKEMALIFNRLDLKIYWLSVFLFASQGLFAFFFDFKLPLSAFSVFLYPVFSTNRYYLKYKLYLIVIISAIIYLFIMSLFFPFYFENLFFLRGVQLFVLLVLFLNTNDVLLKYGRYNFEKYANLSLFFILIGFYGTFLVKLLGYSIPWNIYEWNENNIENSVENFFLPTGFETNVISYTYSALPFVILSLSSKEKWAKYLFFWGLISFIIIGSRGAILAVVLIYFRRVGLVKALGFLFILLFFLYLFFIIYPEFYFFEKLNLEVSDDTRVSGVFSIFLPALLQYPLGYVSNPTLFNGLLALNGGLGPHNILLTPWLESGFFSAIISLFFFFSALWYYVKNSVVAMPFFALTVYACFHNSYLLTGEMRMGIFLAFIYANNILYRR
jgi:hypothetical protein